MAWSKSLKPCVNRASGGCGEANAGRGVPGFFRPTVYVGNRLIQPITPMMLKKIGEHDVTDYDYVVRNSNGGMFVIERHDVFQTWSLWYWCRGEHLSLHHANGEAISFDTPEEVVAFCQTANSKNPEWADFEKRVGKDNFPPGMGNEKSWVPGADFIPDSSPHQKDF